MKDKIQSAIKGARARNPGKIIPAKEIYESIYKAGIKEVLEAINYKTNIYSFTVNPEEWQSKLKEWGI